MERSKIYKFIAKLFCPKNPRDDKLKFKYHGGVMYLDRQRAIDRGFKALNNMRKK